MIRSATSVVVLALIVGCRQGAEMDISMPRRIVDLSPTITEDLAVRLRGAKQFSSTGWPLKTTFVHRVSSGPLYVMNSSITLYDHIGSHADAPLHVIPGGKSVDELPLDAYFGRARVLDFRSKAKDEPIVVADLEHYEIQPGEIVLALVGYKPPTNETDMPSYSFLSGEAAEYLAGIPIKAFATDAPSTASFRRVAELLGQGADPKDVVREHLAFLTQGIANIEGLQGIEQLVGEENIVFVGFPLKIKGASGGPLRAAALVY